mmetsp:Transcript_26883/g.20124  ORF Transcript_26883/g.20124 Transcript_26883/m.20124 type:complete len:100 (+) Transcript_26883:561-860(+)|eukprot:CAMPEP_0202960958 /NCGR_PEP_ID=MMETSP1396-20130829/5077_1 /ASSEMBLY_ACC=CAM_ASM_000872 /TAXON_ID= /ORGANISM="Pseudokeronopsis sp., Strain Brazil" /LENGTH=99 /DNA_ID=CAMNT_0049680491 /DNA_START=561 /DNA_END=860 /DNA_ORIENTATION=+
MDPVSLASLPASSFIPKSKQELIEQQKKKYFQEQVFIQNEGGPIEKISKVGNQEGMLIEEFLNSKKEKKEEPKKEEEEAGATDKDEDGSDWIKEHKTDL